MNSKDKDTNILSADMDALHHTARFEFTIQEGDEEHQVWVRISTDPDDIEDIKWDTEPDDADFEEIEERIIDQAFSMLWKKVHSST